jgi:hypothetical protein
MTHSETKRVVEAIVFLDVMPSSRMIKIQLLRREASFLHDYVISFNIFVPLAPIILFLIVFLY